MKLFGINEFAARFPNAVCGIVTLLVLYRCGKRLFGHSFGILWIIIYTGMLLPFLYFKSGIIDPWFNLFIFLSIWYFSFLTQAGYDKRRTASLLSGIFLGLAVLTKGPAAILVALLCLAVFILTSRSKRTIRFGELMLLVFSCAVLSFAWFGAELIGNGPWFLEEFVTYQIRLFRTEDAGHGGPFFYHWIILLFGCFPASVFMIKAFFMRGSTYTHQRNFYKWMNILFWVVLILFSIVKTKIVHYSSLCYFPLSFLCAYALCYLLAAKSKWNWWISWSIAFIGGIIALALTAFPFFMMNKDKWIVYVKDEFAVANLQAEIDWTALDALPGLILFLALIYALLRFRRGHYTREVYALFISVSLAGFMATQLIVPKIEAFSQNAAISFYESVKDEDAYIQPMYYKSYAHLFYARKKPGANPLSRDHEWLRSGDIDKPVYMVVKLQHAGNLVQYKDIEKIGEKNGFLFFKRISRKTE
jgi:4-amino-4-deoxy-L-arabinose transferase-like glycosyltransferase